jgi:hypothetical protein
MKLSVEDMVREVGGNVLRCDAPHLSSDATCVLMLGHTVLHPLNSPLLRHLAFTEDHEVVRWVEPTTRPKSPPPRRRLWNRD